MLKDFRDNLLGVVTLLVVALGICIFLALNSRTAVRANNTSIQSIELAGSDHHLYAAMYSTKGGLSSTLGLNNTLNVDISAQVTLFNKRGESLTTPAMNITLGPHTNHGFNIADWIHGHGDFDEGSLEVFYHGKSMTLGAQEIVTDANHGLNFDVHLSEYDDFMSSRVDALWWALDSQSEAIVFVANTEDEATKVTPYYYVNGTEYRADPMDLGAHETGSIDIGKALKKLHVHGDMTLGGISLNYTNEPGAIAAVGVIQNKHTGFSTTMRFIDRSGQKTTSLHGASLPIGRPEANFGFPTATQFTPHVIVRNNTSQAVQVNPRIRYTLYDEPNLINLVSLTLPANQVRELDLSPVVNAIGNNQISDSGVEISHSGTPGAIMVYGAAVDQSAGRTFDVPIKDPKNMPFQGGSYPWNIAGDNHAVLHVKSIDAPNDGQKRQFMVKLYYDGGEYDVPLQQVERGQTSKLDIRKLRDDQVKDVLGNVIPMTITGGQLAWYGRANKGAFIGRLSEYDPVMGTSSSFSCPQNCLCTTGFFSGQMTPGIIYGFAGDTFPLSALETDADCNHANQFTYEVYDLEFLSSNANVVAINGHTATLAGAGGADVFVNWSAFSITQQCTALASDGECVDADCPSESVFTPEDNTSVGSLTISGAQTMKDGADFSLPTFTVTGEGATSYQWSFTAPSGAGNSPNVTFGSATAASTTTNGRWFAKPDHPCNAEQDAPYTISCAATFGDSTTKTANTTLTVNAYWDPAGNTDPPTVSGVPTYSFNSATNRWVVSGSGSVTRAVSTPTINVHFNSQFRDKTVAHENVHVQQWTSGILSDLFTVAGLMTVLSSVTDPDEIHEREKAEEAFDLWLIDQASAYTIRKGAAEHDAYIVSDQISPQYIYQNCGRY